MTVTANVIDETPNAEATNYTVKLYNIYNNVVDYAYVSEPLTAGFHEGSSIDVNGKAYSIDIPFYTLTGFDVAVYESSKIITIKPHYDTVNTVSVQQQEINLRITVLLNHHPFTLILTLIISMLGQISKTVSIKSFLITRIMDMPQLVTVTIHRLLRKMALIMYIPLIQIRLN